MIRACRCLPRLAGRQRTIGGLRNSDEGPGAGCADAASRSAMLQCRGSRGRERQRNGFYTAFKSVACATMRVNFAKFSFQKYSLRPAVIRLRPSLSHSQRPDVTRRGPSPTFTCAAARATRVGSIHSPLPRRPGITRSGQPHSSRPESLGRPAVDCRGPSHSLLRAVHHPPGPASLAAARVTGVTESETDSDSLTRSRLRPASLT